MKTLLSYVVKDLFQIFLSENVRKRADNTILTIALVSFLLHLIGIYLIRFGIISIESDSTLLNNPIAAAYTPFSFILIYEVYLLIFYLPKSFTTYVVKQYEIITLIIIRRLFKDLSALELSSEWFEIKGDLLFTYDLVASLALFYLIFQIQKQGKQKTHLLEESSERMQRFVSIKKMLAVILVPTFFIMAAYTFYSWTTKIIFSPLESPLLTQINNLFFEDIFTVLILVDVVLLLISFFYTDNFHKIMRNSGFVVSTILIRMSFGVTGLISTILIVVAVLFGLCILVIHNQYEPKRLQ